MISDLTELALEAKRELMQRFKASGKCGITLIQDETGLYFNDQDKKNYTSEQVDEMEKDPILSLGMEIYYDGNITKVNSNEK